MCLVAHKACASAISLGQSQSGARGILQHAQRGADRAVGTEKAAVQCCTRVFTGTILRDVATLRSEVCALVDQTEAGDLSVKFLYVFVGLKGLIVFLVFVHVFFSRVSIPFCVPKMPAGVSICMHIPRNYTKPGFV